MEGDKEPLEDFFSGYPPFVYNSSAPATREFKRLIKANKWEPKTLPWIEASRAFHTATIRQFNLSYGTNPSSLPDWHRILKQIGVNQLPHTIRECKQAGSLWVAQSLSSEHSSLDSIMQIIEASHVNLVDLVDARGDPTKVVRTFPTEKALSNYTKRTKKIFPKEGAKAGGILEFLLRHIFQPGDGMGKRKRRKKKKTTT